MNKEDPSFLDSLDSRPGESSLPIFPSEVKNTSPNPPDDESRPVISQMSPALDDGVLKHFFLGLGFGIVLIVATSALLIRFYIMNNSAAPTLIAITIAAFAAIFIFASSGSVLSRRFRFFGIGLLVSIALVMLIGFLGVVGCFVVVGEGLKGL